MKYAKATLLLVFSVQYFFSPSVLLAQTRTISYHRIHISQQSTLIYTPNEILLCTKSFLITFYVLRASIRFDLKLFSNFFPSAAIRQGMFVYYICFSSSFFCCFFRSIFYFCSFVIVNLSKWSNSVYIIDSNGADGCPLMENGNLYQFNFISIKID